MATYNGAAFVEEQIQSIIDQSYRDWRLLIHDDGSSDETVKILQKWSRSDERIEVIGDDRVRLGVARNFIHLLQYSTAPLCMFCDQDDIWLPSKVEKMVREINQYDSSKPQVVYSNAFLWSAERGVFSERNTLTYPTTLRQMLFLNTGIQGAAAIFNDKMRELLVRPLDFYAMHDYILLLAGICFGEVHYLHESLMWYRQHSNNLTGNAPGSISKKLQLMWYNKNIPLVSMEHYNGLEAFFEEFNQELETDDRNVVNIFLSLPEKGFLSRVKYIIQYRFQLFDSTFLLLVKMCIRRYI